MSSRTTWSYYLSRNGCPCYSYQFTMCVMFIVTWHYTTTTSLQEWFFYSHSHIHLSPVPELHQVHSSEILMGKNRKWEFAIPVQTSTLQRAPTARDVTKPANICICLMQISCAKSIGCRCRFVVWSKSVPAIITIAIKLTLLKIKQLQTS